MILIAITALLSCAITGVVFLLVANRYFDNEQKKRLLEMRIDERRSTLQLVSPIRLQAYERMVLFLERISPNSLVMRCYKPGMDAITLRSVMSDSIRGEWEHNLSQQVYISSEAWMHVREAKEQMINMINSSAATLPEGDDPAKLAGAIFEAAVQSAVPTDAAIEFLKAEIRKEWE